MSFTRNHHPHTDVFERNGAEFPLPSGGDRRVVSMVRAFMERSSRYREPFLQLARESRALYETWKPGGRSLIQRANLKLPFGFTIIETQVPQLTDVFFKDEEIIKFEGVGPEDAVHQDLLTDFHKHQVRNMKLMAKGAAFVKSMHLDGTAIAKVPYRYQTIDAVERITEVNPLTGQETTRKRSKEEVVFNGPDFELIPIYDFFPDWRVRNPGDISNMRAVVHRTWSTEAALRSDQFVNADGELENRFKNLDQLRLSIASKGTAAWRPPFFSGEEFKTSFERLQDNREPGIKDAGSVEIWEYWGLYDPKSDGNFKEFRIVVGNGDVVLLAEDNFYDYNFKPFVACPNYIRDGEFYGIPELAPIKPLIKEANVIRNARLDNINLSVNPMWLIDRSSGINSKAVYSRPHGIIWTNDMNGIKPLAPTDPSIGSRDEMAFLQQDIQNASGQINAAPTMGQMARTFGRSATGVNLINSFSSNRLGLKAKNLAEYALKPMAWIMLMTNRQFAEDAEWVRIFDPNAPKSFDVLPADAFFRNYDFMVKTDFQTGGPEGELQKFQALSQIFQVAENSQPGTIKFDVLLEDMVRPLIGRHIPRFVRDDQERLQLQAQGLAQQQAVNAAQGAGAPQPNANTFFGVPGEEG